MKRKYSRVSVVRDASIVWRRISRYVLTFCFIASVSYGLYFLCSSLFSVRRIEIVGDRIGVQIDEGRMPRNLLFLPAEKIRADLLSAYPQLSDVKISRIFPHTLRLVFDRRSAVARYDSGAIQSSVAADGMILGPALPEDENLPLISAPDTSLFGPILHAILAFRPLGHLEKVTVLDDGNSLDIHFSDTDIVISVNSDTGPAADTLQTLLSGFRMKGKVPARIDLRFQKPVLSY